MSDAPLVPSASDVEAYFDRCSNWGRWGESDNAGTINLITAEKRRAAAGRLAPGDAS